MHEHAHAVACVWRSENSLGADCFIPPNGFQRLNAGVAVSTFTR